MIDFHVHITPPQFLSKILRPEGVTLPDDLSAAGIKKALKEMGVTHAVIQHEVVRPGETKATNDFARELAKDDDGFFIHFGGFYPGEDPDDLKLLERDVFYGVKLHPCLQRFAIDDKMMYPVYETLSSLKLPVLFHTGVEIEDPNMTFAFPDRILNVHRDFPDLTIIAAHLGAFCMYDAAESLIAGTDMYIDISGSHAFCHDPKQYERILRKHDPDKILFGSDYVYCSPLDELKYLESLNLESDLMDKILYKNAQRLLNI